MISSLQIGFSFLVTNPCRGRLVDVRCSHFPNTISFLHPCLSGMLSTFCSQNVVGLGLGQAMVAQPGQQHLNRKQTLLKSHTPVQHCHRPRHSIPQLKHQSTCVFTHPAASLFPPCLPLALTVPS